MNREQITAWAREAGFVIIDSTHEECAERFAALVAEHERKRWHKAGARAIRMAINIEREACAKVCEEPGWNAANWCAKAIRARGETK